jgi:Uma2 family endonuclease
MATAEALLTAEEFGRRPDPGHPEELVQGRIITMPPPQPRHGQVCVSFPSTEVQGLSG